MGGGRGNDGYWFDKTKTALRAAIRGGNFNNEANAGVFALNLNVAPSLSDYYIGFRACNTSLYGCQTRKQIILACSAKMLWNVNPCRTVLARTAKTKKEGLLLVAVVGECNNPQTLCNIDKNR